MRKVPGHDEYIIDEDTLATLIEESERYHALIDKKNIIKWDKYDDAMEEYLEKYGSDYNSYTDYSYSLLDKFATPLDEYEAIFFNSDEDDY